MSNMPDILPTDSEKLTELLRLREVAKKLRADVIAITGDSMDAHGANVLIATINEAIGELTVEQEAQP